MYIEVDKHHNVWMMSPFKLFMVSEIDAGFKIYQFSKQNGLQNYELSSLLITSDNIYVGGRDGGLDIFDLDEFEISNTAPEVHISSISVNGEYLDFNNFSEEDHSRFHFTGISPFSNLPQELAINSEDNHMSISFAGVDWTAEEDISYSYRLYPMEEDWCAPTQKASIDYRNLPSGDLTFHLKAIGQSQNWSEVSTFQFRVNPPWWQTSQAYLFYLLVLGMLIYLITHLRTQCAQEETEKFGG